jgi:hypothetical protein
VFACSIWGITDVWRRVVDAMRTCEETRQAVVKLNMAYVYRLRRAGFLERLGLEFLAEMLRSFTSLPLSYASIHQINQHILSHF